MAGWETCSTEGSVLMNPTDVLAQLRVTMPDGTEHVVPVTQAQFNIGRVEENELQLPERMVSRQRWQMLFSTLLVCV